jgi:hypothetical protein
MHNFAMISAAGYWPVTWAVRDKDTVSSLTSGENFSATWLRSN